MLGKSVFWLFKSENIVMQTQDFRFSDYVILFYVRGVNFSIKAFISCKKLMLFLYVCCSQHNLSEVAGIWMLNLYSEIPLYSGYSTVFWLFRSRSL